ncbi:NUDIX domain-containing protein [Rhodobacteraceae bacterium D3-12]|nr:NUDIX domain-containing protein [Rhodobacteraceae bacterium D3-12]
MTRRRPIRLATRALIVVEKRLLLVNAFPGADTKLWCAPGGGAEPHSSLPDNLAREVHEETGLIVQVGAPALVNEYHNPADGFHQVEVFFRCTLLSGTLTDDWRDPEGVVTRRRWFTRAELGDIRFKPDSLPDIAFDPDHAIGYDPIEPVAAP